MIFDLALISLNNRFKSRSPPPPPFFFPLWPHHTFDSNSMSSSFLLSSPSSSSRVCAVCSEIRVGFQLSRRRPAGENMKLFSLSRLSILFLLICFLSSFLFDFLFDYRFCFLCKNFDGSQDYGFVLRSLRVRVCDDVCDIRY